MEVKTKKITSILISQPEPSQPNNAYTQLAKKFNLKIDFRPFIHVEGVAAKDFRKEKINPVDYSAVIFTSRNAISHYFRICEEMRLEVPTDMKYICSAESIALYLQKFTQYRKRKIFFGKQGKGQLNELLLKHKKEKFIFPCSDAHNDEIPNFLKANKIKFDKAVIYKTVCSDLSDLSDVNYDIIAFFSPSGIKSLFENFPDFKQNETRIAAFGNTTSKAVLDCGLELNIKAPDPESPSMTMAIEKFIKTNK